MSLDLRIIVYTTVRWLRRYVFPGGRIMRRLHVLGAVVGLLAVLVSPAVAQQEVAGTVVEARSGRPLERVQVGVEGGGGTTTDARGRFRLANLTGTQVILNVAIIGYRPMRVTARVGDQNIAVQLTEMAVNLGELVVTGTVAGAEKRTLGSSVATVRAAESQDQMCGWANLRQRVAKLFEMGNPGGGVKFEDERVGVAVEDEAGQTVVLAVDETVAGGVLSFEGGAQARSIYKFVLKPVGVDGRGFAGLQNAHADRRGGVVQTDRQKAPLVIEDDGQIAGRARVTLLADGLIENPGMSLPQGAFRRRANAQRDSFRGGSGEVGEG